MGIKCPKCQSNNPDTQQYCGECGTQLIPLEEISPSHTKTLETPKEEFVRGTTFAERYDFIEELGTGGMGSVYKVFDKKIEEEVALKILRPEIASDKKTIERFSSELKLARKIRHENVCQMYDINEEEGTHYITMEYVSGEDLKSFIRRVGQLPVGKTISIAKQVCEGLSEAHRLGVVHRDLKPQNIMIDKEGNARIMDFGIARSIKGKGITGAGMMIGTPEYMSPEQVEGKEVDQRSDIYSLGVNLYEMGTGQVPFEGDTPFTIGMKHKSETPKDPKELNAQIPEDLSRVILRCMEKDKEKRYQSASEVRSEVENMEKGIPTTERMIPKRKPITSKEITVTFGLKKLLFPALVGIGIIIIAVIIWQLFQQKQAVPIPPRKSSIAVLPFLDLSPQKDQGYFCDGMTGAIIEKLSLLGELNVSSRTSVMRYKNTDIDIKEIGKELGVSTILEGSVQKEKNHILVRAQVINIEDNFPIWSDHYDQELESVFAIQSDMAQKIAVALKAKLSPGEKEQFEKKPTENLAAYDYYLKGREYYYRYRKFDNEHAIELYKKALELDPGYALAYAGLGDAYAQGALRFRNPPVWLDSAIEASRKAISIDPNCAEAYKALGVVYAVKGRLQESIKSNLNAIEFNPNALAMGNLTYIYGFIGDFAEAMRWAKKNFDLRPMEHLSYVGLGFAYYGLDDFAKAEKWLTKALELQPDFPDSTAILTYTYLVQGMYMEALEVSQKALLKIPNDYRILSSASDAELFSGNFVQAEQYCLKSIEIYQTRNNLLTGLCNTTRLGYIYWKMEKKDEAQKLFNLSENFDHTALEQENESWIIPYDLAVINAIQGKKEEAYNWLQKAIDAGWRYFRLCLRDPRFENLYNDERFKQMIAEVKSKVDDIRERVEKE